MARKKHRVVVKSELCKGCDLCIVYCKKGVLASSEDLNKAGYHYASPDDSKECTGCMVCVLVCPEVAIEVYGE
ncbi:MAG TPA: ferredoxin family protein [Spirochaetota bacterium]|jgi:2-oxoglutarate ferredoxin oxidoreductase subunit delta|nr:ferredoxin family protein [Spirochaetota bacterium]OPZ39691.1 MAG: 2-oxoglutarate-acceptor oxidoreductase subunit OorD [Spirochaetes bacterium ADurb.BinA120]HNU92581.1 ferredoxin family protein [Spirochaetota bacterium]HPI15109.1 ferredoxin family protein [Spirochaetota bacterium]HPO45333.1 ferredoxin family protein [Spirochaetota bacterium]